MSAVAGPSTKPVTITYCAVCTLPTEYCEFGPSVSKCKAHLQETDKEEYERVWGDSELTCTRSLADSRHARVTYWNALAREAGEARGRRGQA